MDKQIFKTLSNVQIWRIFQALDALEVYAMEDNNTNLLDLMDKIHDDFNFTVDEWSEIFG